MNLRNLILILSWVVVGLMAYMAFHNLRWRLKYQVARRGFYALGYFGLAGLLWEITTFVIAPAPAIPGDWKSWLYLGFLLCTSVGILGVAYDHYTRRRDDAAD